MVFNSLQFLIFFPIVLVLYYVVPNRWKNIWLLFASYIFYACWNIKYCVLLLVCTMITYFTAFIVDKLKIKTVLCKQIFFWGLFCVFGILAGYKYTNFMIENINALFRLSGLRISFQKLNIILPVGISFFTFQAAGYLIDVYQGKISVEKNFIEYALFVSFFPQLLSGPISRASAILPQYRKIRKFQYENLQKGFLLMIWGFFLKLVIADRAAMLVNTVYNEYIKYTGIAIVFATVIYGVQIYCDFWGYSSMAIGSAEMLGIELPNNFDTPYLSISIKEFWRRWHISLSSWLRDYVYFPLGGSRCSKMRKHLNVAITFLVSGLWHGAKWSFIAWGLLHGIYQIVGDLSISVRKKICEWSSVNTETLSIFVKAI